VIFRELAVVGAYVVEPEKRIDDRGFFARTFCAEEFAVAGLDPSVGQVSVSYNRVACTLRGLHYQADPHGDVKLVRCTRGRAFDVLVDLRPSSSTYRHSATLVLDADHHSAIYAPVGVAHGFLTLADDTEVLYQMATPHRADAGRGLRWNDPGIDVHWPSAPIVISERDRAYPDYAW